MIFINYYFKHYLQHHFFCFLDFCDYIIFIIDLLMSYYSNFIMEYFNFIIHYSNFIVHL
jgi:hypothetical protein